MVHMTKRSWVIGAAAGAAIVAGAITFTTVRAAGGDDGNDDNEVDTPISGSNLERASAVALAHTGGGQVTGTEVGDEESYYEIEVTFDDGSQVDVQLDEQFAVVGQDGDSDQSGDAD